MIVWDGMFLEEELPMRRGWGHSSIEDGVDFFSSIRKNTEGSKLAIMHHAPSRTDEQLNVLAKRLLTPGTFFAKETQNVII